jgi:kinesin family protein 4/21/27
MEMETEVSGRVAAKENVDPVANRGAISPEMDAHEEKELPVTVALMVRPLVGAELVDGCRECVSVHATEPSVSLVSEHKFTYDHVYHGSGASEKALYAQCVEPLVRGLLGGYNATVLAYGQTGSGKTFTMGTARDASRDFASETEREPLGVIPRVMRTLFERVAALPGDTSVAIKVGFIEIHKEEIRDLLRPKSAVTLRDAPDGGGVALVGAREKEVRTIEEMAKALRDGSNARATAATGMNDRSSRSHAIFTIHVETVSAGADAPGDVTRAKMHLVDLAGSERAKRTKAEGARLQEGIQINKGLLALGNVISALGDDKRRRAKGAHVPYRDSKLTRLLQDSLGGNSRTVMVACISPADANLDETLNTLKYANRARNIVNTPTVTFDENSPNAALRVAKLRRALAAARSEIAHLKLKGAGALGSGGGGAFESFGGLGSGDTDVSAKLDAMEARAMLAEAEASRLRADLKSAEENAAASAAAELAAGVERDVLALKLQDAGVSAEEDHGGSNVIRGYLSTIQSLRNEQSRLKNQLRAAREGRADPYAEDPAASYDLDDEPAFDDEPEELEAIDDEEELEEDAEGDDLQAELDDVERTLQAKEARMRAMSSQAAEMQAEVDAAIARGGGGAAAAAGAASAQQDVDVEVVREKYGRLLKSLETEKLEIAAERDRLLAALSAAAKNGADARKAAEVKTRGRLLELEQRLKEVSKLAAKHKDAARLREKSDMAAKALQADIQRLRAARVELVRRMERATKEGIAKQRESERALQQAKKEGRRHALAARKAQSAVDRQAAVLRRKTEEASNAREQLRALQAAAKANRRKHAPGARDVDAETAAAPVASRPEISVAAPAPVAAAVASVEAVYKNDAAGPGTGLGLNARKQWLEAELVASVERAELRAALEESLARRAALGRRLPRLASPGPSSEKDAPSPESRAEVDAAAEMRAVTEQIATLQERLYRSEAREEQRGGARRWSRVRSLGEARSLLTILFNSAAAARRAGASGLSFGAADVGDSARRSTKEPTRLETTADGVAPPPARDALARTPSVVREADAVLRALKKKSAPVREKRKKATRPAWQDVGPATLLPPASEEKRAKSPEHASVVAAAALGSGSSPATSASSASESASDDSEVSSTSASASLSLSLSTPAAEKPDERSKSLEELISTCRDARRRAEGLLDGSAAKARSPLGDVSNGAESETVSETVHPKRLLTFGVSGLRDGADRVERTPGQL